MKSINQFKSLVSSNLFTEFIKSQRNEVIDILNGKSNKLILIVGPCSVHNYEQFIDYLDKFKLIKEKYESKILFLVRTYVEKSRSTGHWRGYLNDPNLDNSCDLELGILNTRKLMYEMSKRKLAIATEILCPITCYYLRDFVTWSAIGARSCESQVNRIVSSDIEYSIGYKNDRNGNIQIPLEGINYSKNSHTFLNTNDDGMIESKTSNGNRNCHLILRGSLDKVNYKKEDVNLAENMMEKFNVNTKIIIDCSHDNSMRSKNPSIAHKNQKLVVYDVIEQIKNGNKSIGGLMIESNINEGKQSMEAKEYGVSITDACIDIEETEMIIKYIYDNL